MTTEKFANNGKSTLNANITNSQTTLVVASAVSFPSAGNFRLIIDSEIMIVTGVSGATFTVLRAQEGSSAAAHTAGVVVAHLLTAGVMAALNLNNKYCVVKFGSGSGGDTNFDLGQFTQVNFSGLANFQITDLGGNYDVGSDVYVCPVDGVYQIVIKIRCTDSLPGDSCSLMAGDLNAIGDGPDNLWFDLNDDQGGERNGAINVIENAYAAGTQIAMWTFNDSGSTTASDGSMSVKLLYPT